MIPIPYSDGRMRNPEHDSPTAIAIRFHVAVIQDGQIADLKIYNEWLKMQIEAGKRRELKAVGATA